MNVSHVVLVKNGRVAIGDKIGAKLGGEIVVVMIGERPGLSAADSLGVYITYEPREGRTDADRNCISNIRAGGLSFDEAAWKASWIIAEALKRGLTGVALKDESELTRSLESPSEVTMPKQTDQ
jgi:ethanolamine ammonia-lyase small subunit